MAGLVRQFRGNFAETLQFLDRTILAESVSATLEESHTFQTSTAQVATRIYERYSYAGNNRVSLTLTLVGEGDNLQVYVASTGGSQAVFFKINTWGEESFLETIEAPLDNYIRTLQSQGL